MSIMIPLKKLYTVNKHIYNKQANNPKQKTNNCNNSKICLETFLEFHLLPISQNFASHS